MRELLQRYAVNFSMQLEQMTQSEAEQRSVNHPIVFLFLGDQSTEPLVSIKKINEEKWSNSSGVIYFHAYQTQTAEAENILSFQLPAVNLERKQKRKGFYESFYNDDSKLIELNKAFRRLLTKIAEYGRVYSSLQKVNLCVVTAIEDPANILIQEFTLLLKSILQESFKTIEVDMYGLVNAKSDEGNFALTTAFGMSFLKELDGYQGDRYSFNKNLQLTEDHLRLPVTHLSGPLFDMVYLLSDKNENGLLSADAMKANYEMISRLNLLKNRKMITDYHEKMDSYNHSAFRLGIRGNSKEPVYASAGFAKVSRPNKAIALQAAHHFFQEFLSSIKAAADRPMETILDLIGLAEDDLNRFNPSSEKLSEMHSLLGSSVSYSGIKRLTVAEAEELIFENGAERFFTANFKEPALEHLNGLNLKEQIESRFNEAILHNEQYGLYSAYVWTAEKPGSALSEVQKMRRETKNAMLETEAMLEQMQQQIVDTCDFKKSYLLFSDKKNLAAFLDFFFNEIYGQKLELVRLHIRQEVLRQFEEVLADIHRTLRVKLDEITQVESVLKQMAAEGLYDADDDWDKNIAEYYTGIINSITNDIADQHGPHFFAEERFFGNLLRLLENGATALLERLLEICRREVLSRKEFHRNFEDELLERANVTINYENRDILSKEDLFKQLYNRLNENSAIHIEVFNYTTKHRYAERYFFGDFYSQFMRYALEKENETRLYKAGCAHEKNASGIEKLALMGGFKLTDLMYYRNGEKYYSVYREDGYEFHAEEPLVVSPVKGD